MSTKNKLRTSKLAPLKESISVMEKEKIKELKQKIKPKQTKTILCDPNLMSHLEAIHKRFAVTIYTDANNFGFICKKYYISKLLAEIGLSNPKSKTYSKATHSIREIIEANINYRKKFGLNIKEIDKSLPIMYWLPKMHKTPIGARLIVLQNTAAQSHSLIQFFKMIFNTVESFDNKSFFFFKL